MLTHIPLLIIVIIIFRLVSKHLKQLYCTKCCISDSLIQLYNNAIPSTSYPHNATFLTSFSTHYDSPLGKAFNSAKRTRRSYSCSLNSFGWQIKVIYFRRKKKTTKYFVPSQALKNLIPLCWFNLLRVSKLNST